MHIWLIIFHHRASGIMSMSLPFFIVDAFTDTKFEGAQLAVFLDADHLNTQQMQIIAREMNLTETVFIVSSNNADALYGLRVFSPQQELFYTGHPVVAASFILHTKKQLSQQNFNLCLGERTINIDVTSTHQGVQIKYLCADPVRLDSFVPSAKELAEFLSLSEKDIAVMPAPMLASCVEDYLIVPIKNKMLLRHAVFVESKWTTSFVASLAHKILLFCESETNDDSDYYARLMGKGISAYDDPPIAPATPAFAHYLLQQGVKDVNVVMQRGGGERRKSLLHVQAAASAEAASTIKVGGSAVLVAKGEMEY